MEGPCSHIFIHFTAVITTDHLLLCMGTWVTVDIAILVTTGLMDMEISFLEITLVPLLDFPEISAMAEIMTTDIAMAIITKDITIMVTITMVIEPDIVKNSNLTVPVRLLFLISSSHIYY